MKVLYTLLLLTTITLSLSVSTAHSQVDGSELFGNWNLEFDINGETMPGWLHAERSGRHTIVGAFVGSSGNSRPISVIHYSVETGDYTFTIPPQWEPVTSDLILTFTIVDNELQGHVVMGDNRYPFAGKSAPSLIRENPPVWGTPVRLLDDPMSKWIIPENNQFVMQEGILVNKAMGGNLVSKETFDDFKLHTEFRYPEGSNSGIYLRGRYEVQIEDGFGKDITKQIMAGIYGFIEPSVNASKQSGEWQTLDITLVGRMVTVVHNGIEVISKRSIPGITGGALDGREGEPGPIMLQGDHGPIEFKKITITPAL